MDDRLVDNYSDEFNNSINEYSYIHGSCMHTPRGFTPRQHDFISSFNKYNYISKLLPAVLSN